MATEQFIKVQKPNFKIIVVDIVGRERLQVHRLGKKLREEFEARDDNKPIKKKNKRDYDAEFLDSLHYIDANYKSAPMPRKITRSTKFGFPSSGFKKAIVSACRNYKNLKMTEIKGRVFVLNEFVEIKGTPIMDKFWRRIGSKGSGTGTPDIGVRAVFPKWEATLYIRYNADLIDAESVVNLVQSAGESVGIGEDRPERQGNIFGTWDVKSKMRKCKKAS